MWRAEERAQLGEEMKGEEDLDSGIWREKEWNILEEGQGNTRKAQWEMREQEWETGGDTKSETERMRKWNYVVMETGMDLKSKTRM